MEKKDQIIVVQCTSKDKEIFCSLAEHFNVSLSTFFLASASVGAEFLVRYLDALRRDSQI